MCWSRPEGAYPGTKKLYFDDSYLFASAATVLGVEQFPDPKDNGTTLTVVIMDQTCFYPQGGECI
jgi:Ser-tRNA(Ala) deacylase AlaX